MHPHPYKTIGASEETVSDLLKQAGYDGAYILHVLPGGANNRVYRLHINGAELLLKSYFSHPDDPRDRLGTEVAVSDYAWSSGVRCIPNVLAYDRHHRIALYDYVEGGRLTEQTLDKQHIDQAAIFYEQLNSQRLSVMAANLPAASEACFSFAAHLSCVEQRLQRLFSMSENDLAAGFATDFICGSLVPAWHRVKKQVVMTAAQNSVRLDRDLALIDGRISPSDFGFHNAIVKPDGRIVFIDFEYAGWDDPVKMVCDFFCQPEVPVPLKYLRSFSERVFADQNAPECFLERVFLLMPAYKLKWCCILLNDFLPGDGARRRFANEDNTIEDRLIQQLQKAERALTALTEYEEWQGESHALY
jgi:predicted Ser/Thr protein kinase